MERGSAQVTPAVDEFRAETRYRAWFATLLAITIAVVYFGSSFPFFLDQMPAANPVGPILVSCILFAMSLAAIAAILCATMTAYRLASDLTPLRAASARRVFRELNRLFGMSVAAVTFGGRYDGRISAMNIGGRNIVGIGRGALPLIKREPVGFRYRVAHEYAHLAAGDPRWERWLLTVYVTTLLFLLVAYGANLWNSVGVLAALGRVSGWNAIKDALLGWMRFGFVANLTLFGSILLMLNLEQRSATRLREFYADATAAMAVGPVKQVFRSSHPVRSRFRRFWAGLLDLHPEPSVRAAAIDDRMTVYRADMMLFMLLGFFSAFIVEMVLQLLFTSASAGLATFDDRRASVWRYLAIGSTTTLGMVTVGALLAASAHFLILSRLAATIRVAAALERSQRFVFIASVPFLITAGALLLLATSLGTLWDLQQTGWNLARYVPVAWDRLTVHCTTLLTLCGAIILQLLLMPRGFMPLLALGSFPSLSTLLVGYILYR